MSRRRFNSRERVTLWLFAAGCCVCRGCSACQPGGCLRDLDQGWHADHKIPFVRSRRTDVSDGQALCPPCNLVKGAR